MKNDVPGTTNSEVSVINNLDCKQKFTNDQQDTIQEDIENENEYSKNNAAFQDLLINAKNESSGRIDGSTTHSVVYTGIQKLLLHIEYV